MIDVADVTDVYMMEGVRLLQAAGAHRSIGPVVGGNRAGSVVAGQAGHEGEVDGVTAQLGLLRMAKEATVSSLEPALSLLQACTACIRHAGLPLHVAQART